MRTVSVVLYALGVVAATLLAVIAIWPDLEASLFDAALSSQEPLDSLNCPLVISGTEAGAISVTFANALEEKVSFRVRARISAGFATLMREETTSIELAAGEAQTLSWPISGEDAAFGRIVLARIYAFRGLRAPSRDNSCGVLVISALGLTGRQLVTALLTFGLVGLAAGGVLWVRQLRPVQGRDLELSIAAGALAGLVLAAMAAGMLGLWLAGLLTLIFAVLLGVVLVERFVTSR